MNINKTLYEKSKRYFGDYGCDATELDHLLFSSVLREEKQLRAISVMEKIIKRHSKMPLVILLDELANIEFGVKEMEIMPWLRDHVVHAILTYLLGIYINEKMMSKIGTKVNPFQWKVACLFHDIAYPIAIASNIQDSYGKRINEIVKRYHDSSARIIFKTLPTKFTKLQKLDTSTKKPLSAFKIIENCLNKWEIKVHPKKEYDLMINKGKICHGMLSSLTILYLIDLMYQRNNPERKNEWPPVTGEDGYESDWSEKHFDKYIIPACTAIFIHNLGKEHFISTKIDPIKAPIAFLLKLCDSLQEWQRPSNKNPPGEFGESANKFDINITKDSRLLFYADLSNKRKNEIEDDIKSILSKMDYFEIKNIKEVI